MSNYLDLLAEVKKEHELEHTLTINSRILLVDGLNTFIRAFSVDPSCNENGAHIGGITGFLKSIGYAIKILNPTRCIIVFDGPGGSTRRRKIFPEYKGKRKVSVRYNRSIQINNPEDEKQSMMMQLNRLVQYLECLPVTILSVDNIEADDTISYIATSNIDESNGQFIIMSSDKDFYQLVNDKVTVWSPTKKKLYTCDNLLEEYGISCQNFLLYRILDGDVSDNISGIRGIGLKTLKKRFPFLSEHREYDVKELIEYSKDKKEKVYQSLLESVDILDRNYKLMQLKNVDISASAKMKILSSYRNKVRRLNKPNFHVMALQDQLNAAIPNLDFWMLSCFGKLNSFSLSQKD